MSAYTVLRMAGPDDPSGVPQAIRHIQDALGFGEAFEIQIAEGEDNAMTKIERGRRIMVIDVGFLLKANRLASTRWAAIQVLAHEVGHHLAQASEPLENELEADYWSGRALKVLGAASNAASASILAIGGDFDSETHPNKYVRARAIVRGWNSA